MEYEYQKYPPPSPDTENNTMNVYGSLIMILVIIFISILSNTFYICTKSYKRYKIFHYDVIIYHQDEYLLDNCSICLETYRDNDKLCKLKCEHLYHKKCIGKWMKQSNLCPLCKDEIL